jgi:hypothetical protein
MSGQSKVHIQSTRKLREVHPDLAERVRAARLEEGCRRVAGKSSKLLAVRVLLEGLCEMMADDDQTDEAQRVRGLLHTVRRGF